MGKTTNKKNVELNIVYRNIKELKPYKKNAKKHPKEQVERIANSIKEFGFTQPVIIDTNNCVVAGHGRILGAKKAGLKQVPTVMLEDLTEEQIKAYRLVDNKLNESEWDFSLLDEELGILSDDIDMELFGFDEDMSDEKLEKKKIEFEIKEKYEVHIICKDEKQMEQVYNKTKGLGMECKLVSTL
jgi:ParB-like chromosome segregation protein Spo0J